MLEATFTITIIAIFQILLPRPVAAIALNRSGKIWQWMKLNVAAFKYARNGWHFLGL